ncbi:MAG TPA: NAD(P)-binding domain-containing protein, partial [Burkholderiaceae bacterium]|nr:NAD(P)-binding domain-containing protein [Burkholderiaceae bacterium]
MQRQRICFVGLGMMGAPMAANLRRAGFPVVAADLDPQRVEPFCREHDAEPLAPQTDTASLDAAITMLPDSDAVESAVFGDGGLAVRLRRGATVIDMS